ncbi:MAG: hypothetical protein JWR18_3983 [Segetibacter sp.]|nr:hypothetical protein [Segetibacter sp.]
MPETKKQRLYNVYKGRLFKNDKKESLKIV